MHPIVKTFLAGVGILSDAYNLFIINLVKQVMGAIYEQSEAATSAISTAALVGAVLGQLVFGALADKLGRRVMFISTISCVIVGALGSASPVASSTVPIYTQLCIWLFILGFGVGGEYPLSATVSSENNTVAGRGAAVSSVFSMQGIGNVLASFVMYVCLVACARSPGSMPLDWVWRTALLVGAVPGLATVYWRYKMEESKHFVRHKSTKAMVAGSSLNSSSTSESQESLLGGYAGVGDDARSGAVKKACATFDLHNTWKTLYDFRWTLIGTAGNWFLFDISYYSNSLFSGSVLSEIGFSGNSSTASGLEKVALGNLYLALIGLPGYFVAIWAIDRMGRRRMQWFGFLMMAILFGILAIALEPIKANATGAFVFLYGLTFFFSNFGPNTTTFVIPAEAFPTSAKATCHGISAASGKIGAALGAAALKPLLDAFGSTTGAAGDSGLRLVFGVCGSIALLGVVWTLIFTKETGKLNIEDLDAHGYKAITHANASNAADMLPLSDALGNGGDAAQWQLSHDNVLPVPTSPNTRTSTI